MFRFSRGNGAVVWLAVLLAAAVLPSAADAAWLGFRNDLNSPVVVMVVTNAARGKSHVLYPGEVSWDSVLQAGNRGIVIYDASRKPLRVVYRNTVRCGDKDVLFSIQPHPKAAAAVTLVPAKKPNPPDESP